MRACGMCGLGWLLAAGSLVVGQEASGAKTKKTRQVSIGPVQYTVPETWEAKPPSSSMRKAQLAIPLVAGDTGKLEFIVFYAPSGMGENDANIERWIKMFSTTDGDPKTDKFETGKLKITTLEIAGVYHDKPPLAEEGVQRENYRMYAAIVEPPGDAPYYIRFTGPRKTLEANREAWLTMLKTAKYKAPE